MWIPASLRAKSCGSQAVSGLWGAQYWIWPVHPQPKFDELLSSWMVRLAHANGCKVHTFYAMEFGRERQIWNRDIDRLAPAWLLEGLANRTRCEMSQIHAMTLRSYEGILYERHNDNGNTRWILPLGVFHRTRERKGVQYCPVCLATDVVPYFRKQWRLAYFTECDQHGVLLRDACAGCGAPVIFHRAELGRRSFTKPLSIAHCYGCGEHLSHGPLCYGGVSDWRHRITLNTLLTFHDQGWACLDDLVFQFSHLLFDVLGQLCKILAHNKNGHRLLYDVERNYRSELIGPLTDAHYFEDRTVLERHRLFMAATWLLLDWPQRFLTVMDGRRVTSTLLLKDMHSVPYWYERVVREYRFFPNPISAGSWP